MSRGYGKSQRNKNKKKANNHNQVSSITQPDNLSPVKIMIDGRVSSYDINKFMKKINHSMPCHDCSKNTAPRDQNGKLVKRSGEYFAVKHYVWYRALRNDENRGNMYLCISCLEKRLERDLTPDDFSIRAIINANNNYDTPLLTSRKGHDFTNSLRIETVKKTNYYEKMIELHPDDQGKYVRHLARMMKISVDEVFKLIYGD